MGETASAGAGEPAGRAGPAGPEDGTAAVLYGMFASFTEALDRFDSRLAAIEEALRAGPGEAAERLRSIEAALAGAGGGWVAVGGGVGGAGAGGATEGGATEGAAGREAVEAVEAAVARSLGSLQEALDGRASAVEGALRSVREALEGRASGVEAAVASLHEALDRRVSAAEAAVAERSETLDRRAAAVQSALEELRELLQAHVDETSHSLGRRAGEAGRRLVADLGLRARPRSGGGPPAPGSSR